MSHRTTRSRAKGEALSQPTPQVESLNIDGTNPNNTYAIPTSILSISARVITSLPTNLTKKQTGLNEQSQSLLLQKQRSLRTLNLASNNTKQEYFVSQSTSSRKSKRYPLQPTEEASISHAVSATLIFAQESCGTAVCIHESGLILTCAHCVAESRDELEQDHTGDQRKPLWLLVATGEIVLATCIAWDGRRDLALLRVASGQNFRAIATEMTIGNVSPESDASQRGFTCLRISPSRPPLRIGVVCIGQPGSEDLETAVGGVRTGYPVLAISQGQFLGYAWGEDVEDNSEIGALKHDAWTYWGHSGAPIVDFRGRGGCLVGLHSSWDEQTGVRRGVGIEAIHAFLGEIDHVLQTGKSSNITVIS